MSFFDHLSPKTLAAVIGDPVSHSKSPHMHNQWFQQLNKEGEYSAIQVAPEDLPQFIHELRHSSLRGVNVTIPHKENILPLCDELTSDASVIGAVNTITIEKGQLKGSNTDAFGFIQNIKNTIPNFNFTSGPVVVIGAGGAARAVIYGLLQENVPEIYLTNRTQQKAEDLANVFQRIQIIPWEERHNSLTKAQLLVNTTSLGMKGQPKLDLDLAKLPSTAIVNDLVYTPLQTQLLKNAEVKSNQTVTGIGMLIEQGRKSFQTWFGDWPDITPDLQHRLIEDPS